MTPSLPINPKKILLVEDEHHLAFNITYNLQSSGYEIIHVKNGLEALATFENSSPFDLIIMDIMIPHLDGFQVIEAIRKVNTRVGILILTARASEEDIIKGFEIGADDYLTKPFKLKELLLRVRRMAERSEFIPQDDQPPRSSCLLEVGHISLNTDSLVLNTQNGTFNITLLEGKVLAEFLDHPGVVLSREYLLNAAWGIQGSIETRTVDNFILRLRRYIEVDPSHPQFILSVRGRGYRFQENP